MAIYLKIERPDGKPFHFITPGTNQRDTKKEPVVLFNDRKPNRDLTAEEEEWLLRQDPHLVCTEVPKFSKEFPTQEAKLSYQLKEQKALVVELGAKVENQAKHLENADVYPEKIETLTLRNKELGEQVKVLLAENKNGIATIARLNKEVVELKPKDKSK